MICLVLLGGQVNAQQRFNCLSYELTIDGNYAYSRDYEQCYRSSVELKWGKKHQLIVTTDSTYARFSILRKYELLGGWMAFAVMPGKPDQAYIIKETTHTEKNIEEEVTHYVFSYNPVRINGRPLKLKGSVLWISNHQVLCKQ